MKSPTEPNGNKLQTSDIIFRIVNHILLLLTKCRLFECVSMCMVVSAVSDSE